MSNDPRVIPASDPDEQRQFREQQRRASGDGSGGSDEDRPGVVRAPTGVPDELSALRATQPDSNEADALKWSAYGPGNVPKVENGSDRKFMIRAAMARKAHRDGVSALQQPPPEKTEKEKEQEELLAEGFYGEDNDSRETIRKRLEERRRQRFELDRARKLMTEEIIDAVIKQGRKDIPGLDGDAMDSDPQVANEPNSQADAMEAGRRIGQAIVESENAAHDRDSRGDPSAAGGRPAPKDRAAAQGKRTGNAGKQRTTDLSEVSRSERVASTHVPVPGAAPVPVWTEKDENVYDAHEEHLPDSSRGLKLRGYRKRNTYNSYGENSFKSRDPGKFVALLAVVVPIVFVTFVYGYVPLQSPSTHTFSDWAMFALVITPITWTTVAYLRQVTLFFFLVVDRPFRPRLVPLLFVALSTGGLTSMLYLIDKIDVPIRLWGIVMFVVTFAASWAGAWFEEHRKVPQVERDSDFKVIFKYYLKTEMFIAFSFLMMIAYVVAFRFADGVGEVMLPLARATYIFIGKKVLLSYTVAMELEPAMFLSAFVLPNLSDIIAIMALPSVASSAGLVSIYLVPLISNLFLLGFLTMPWFRFRCWIKTYLKRLFARGKKGPYRNLHVLPDYKDLPDDRGETLNHPGYLRRQARFFWWNLASQIMAMATYAIVSVVLRYGINSEYYPFDREFLSHDDYVDTLFYAGGTAISAIGSGVLGYLFIRHHSPRLWDFLVITHDHMKDDSKYLGFIASNLVASLLVAMAIILLHNQVYWGFGNRGING